jgi:hypothetical protein
MKKAIVVLIILGITSLAAQEANAPKKTNSAAGNEEQAKPSSKQAVYRFEYTLTELNGKQKINSRKFDILTNSRGEMRTGSRIPVPTGAPSQFSYVDTGLTAEMRYVPRNDGDIDLHVDVNMNFIASPDSPAGGSSTGGVITRSINIRVDTQIKPGAPTVLGTVEDVASTHSYELSVTANPPR